MGPNKFFVVDGITWQIEQRDKFYKNWILVGSWCNELGRKWTRTTVTSSWSTVTLFLWWISEKHVSQHGRPSPRVLSPGLSKHESGALLHFPAMYRNILVLFYSYPWWLWRTVCIRIYRYKRTACYSIWSQRPSHTTVSVSVATLRSRQRITKEMVGGKMTRNRLGYSTTSHLASSIWVKYGVISRIVVFAKVKAAGTLKWPCGLIWGHHGWKNLTFTYKWI